ncbi:predicted protein [Naegleria gruberi]|uniref:Predicted protein n=1 Tax=Naegleria gruberi TaxID=5762 RepID=D2VGJ8_NAEGR|nr:uncharacterized protein NAEGRDRAFT_68004 [Naegleria gruberi]EFC44078.1 predicted protein [Naegleria gruberi]|eukprot:XP_002676822.1 predicted protein [Naegleria gruberi strain NEG-M]
MLKSLGLAWNQAMVRDELFEVDLSGKVCLVTGATIGGIGYETAKKMYQLGCHVVVVCRSDKNGKEACDLMEKECSGMKGIGIVEYMLMDLSDLKSAGVMACPYNVTAQGIEIQFATNHLGHFLLTISLMELIEKVAGRIINVASIGSKLYVSSENDINSFSSFSLEIRNFKSSNSKVSTFTLHPGGVKTNLQKSHNGFAAEIINWILNPLFKTPYEGAQTSLQVALAPLSQLENGGYYMECQLDEASPFADDVKLQDTLWETSMTLVKDYL